MIKPPDNLLTAMDKALKNTLRLSRVANGGELFDVESPGKRKKRPSATRPNRRYLLHEQDREPLRVTVSQEFELYADGIIVDHRLGTIGLLQICRADESEDAVADQATPSESIEKEIDRFIREAVYMRHLLLEHAADQGQPYFVELVLVVPWNGLHRLPDISKSLRQALQETTYLHAIGLNVWTGSEKDFQLPSSVRRAFPWLLTAVGDWYDEYSPFDATDVDVSAETTSVMDLKLAELTLDNFRLPGQRTWEPAKGSLLHVIHGHNGTGKSSLVEAVELLLTGQIQRLQSGPADETVDYAKILKNDLAAEPATLQVTLKTGGPDKKGTWTINDTGLAPKGKAASLKLGRDSRDAGSFRLDQTLTDDLVRSDAAERARRFLRAFFPEEQPQVEAAQNAENEFDKAWKALEGDLKNKLRPVRGKPPMKDVATKLAWLDSSAKVLPQLIEWASLGNAVTTLRGLANVIGGELPNLPEAGGPRDSAVLPEDLSSWDTAWEKATDRAQTTLRNIERLTPVLQELDQWQAGTTGARGGVEQLTGRMNVWLEQHVVWDLSAKEAGVLATIRKARRLDVARPLESLLLADIEAAKVDTSAAETRVAELREVRDKAREVVATFHLESDVAEGETPGLKPRFTEELLQQCERFFPAVGSVPVSAAIADALRQDETTSAKLSDGTTVRPGAMGGARPLIERLEEWARKLRKVDEDCETRRLPFAEMHRQLSALYQAARRGQMADERVVRRFCDILQPGGLFDDARNELMALLTPARWAYEDLSSDYTLEAGKLDFKTRDVSAFLRLNTAELNTFALALFLLRAPRLPNPLNLLMLDDPFQNLDELSVTTIARGIGRLVRHWSGTGEATFPLSHWQLVITINGEENAERFRREIPCTVYYLPWLGATAQQPDGGRQAGEKNPEIRVAPLRVPNRLYSVQNLDVSP